MATSRKSAAELARKVEGAVDVGEIERLVAERKLTTEGMSAAAVTDIRDQMERAAARRLQPHFVSAFCGEGSRCWGAAVRAREGSVRDLPRSRDPKQRDRLIGRADPVLDRYARIAFEKR